MYSAVRGSIHGGERRSGNARIFGIAQPKISYIMNAMIEKISSDDLVGLLAKTGGDCRYSFKQPAKLQVAKRLSAQCPEVFEP